MWPNPHLAVVVLAGVVALSAGCNRQEPAASGPGSLAIDFRQNPDYAQFFRPEKDGHAQYVSADQQGLRIAVPQGTTTDPVGLILKQAPRGDFDIKVAYELLKADAGNGWGSGFQVLLKLDTPGHDVVFVARQARGDGQSLVFQHMTDGADGKRVSRQSGSARVDPARPSGTIGLVRKGSRLAVTCTAGDEPTPSLGEFDVGAEPVSLVRIAANPERGKYPVDVRVLEFDLRANDLAEAAPASHGRLLWPAAVVAFVVVAGLTFWTVRRRLAARVKTAS